MALFGPQLIYTVIMFILLTKIGKFYSSGRFLLCHKLFRYLSPNSNELKKSVRNYYKNQSNFFKLNLLFFELKFRINILQIKIDQNKKKLNF